MRVGRHKKEVSSRIRDRDSVFNIMVYCNSIHDVFNFLVGGFNMNGPICVTGIKIQTEGEAHRYEKTPYKSRSTEYIHELDGMQQRRKTYYSVVYMCRNYRSQRYGIHCHIVL